MQRTYWVTPSDKSAFLISVMNQLAGENTQIAFEGNLSNCDFSSMPSLPISGEIYFWSNNPRNKNNNTQTIILPLTKINADKIIKKIIPNNRFIEEIDHIQIQKENEIQLLVGDNFDDECISVGSMISSAFLSNLKNNGTIQSYTVEND